MFETATIRNLTVNGQDIDAGAIAETLLFYNKLHILALRGSISAIIQKIGEDNFLHLLNSGYVNLTYSPTTFGVLTNTTNLLSSYRFAGFRIAATEKNRKIRNPESDLEDILLRQLGGNSKAKKFIQKLLDKTLINSALIDDFETSAISHAQHMISDQKTTTACVKQIIDTICPQSQINYTPRFDLFKDGDDYIIDTNIDFHALNSGTAAKLNLIEGITPAHIMSIFLEASADIHIAATNLAEIVTTPLTSKIIEAYTSEILRKRHRNEQQIFNFNQMALHGFGSIRESINSGSRTFSEFIDVLDKADKFKKWLSTSGPDATLIDEYFRECTAKTWINKLPNKTIRFIIFNTLGTAASMALGDMTGTAAGLAISAFDNYIFERIAHGWKPSHFIEGALTDFIK